MPDYTIRQLLRSQSYAARKTGLIAETYQTNPAGLAALALDASKGDVKAAQAMLITAGLTFSTALIVAESSSILMNWASGISWSPF